MKGRKTFSCIVWLLKAFSREKKRKRFVQEIMIKFLMTLFVLFDIESCPVKNRLGWFEGSNLIELFPDALLNDWVPIANKIENLIRKKFHQTNGFFGKILARFICFFSRNLFHCRSLFFGALQTFLLREWKENHFSIYFRNIWKKKRFSHWFVNFIRLKAETPIWESKVPLKLLENDLRCISEDLRIKVTS